MRLKFISTSFKKQKFCNSFIDTVKLLFKIFVNKFWNIL